MEMATCGDAFVNYPTLLKPLEKNSSAETRPTLFPEAYVSDWWWQATKRAAQKHMSLQELLCFQRGDANNFGMLGCVRGLTMATN